MFRTASLARLFSFNSSLSSRVKDCALRLQVETLEDRLLLTADPIQLLSDARPQDLTDVNGVVFFTNSDATHGRELWKSDGTAAGTILVKDINPGTTTNNNGTFPKQSRLSNLTNVNGTLFFVADDGTNGVELWKSDGTTAGTVLVKDINPGSADGLNNAPSLTNINGTLFFKADNGTKGVELWKSDGTAAGTVLVKDINPGAGSSMASQTDNKFPPANFANMDGTLFFAARNTTTGYELWKSDGTAAGTVLVKDISPGATSTNFKSLYNVDRTLFFTAKPGDGSDIRRGIDLWKSDGTAAGTVPVKDINPSDSISFPGNFTHVGGTLFFTNNDGINGREIWKSDGTAAGTVMVKDIFPGTTTDPYFGTLPNSSDPNTLTNVNGTLFFHAKDEAHGEELWKSDGTAAGTVLVKDIKPGASSGRPSWFRNVNGTLFFKAVDDFNVHGEELWKSDGTQAGTVLVKDINLALFNGVGPGTASSSPYLLTNVNGKLFFSADDGLTPELGLWVIPEQLEFQGTAINDNITIVDRPSAVTVTINGQEYTVYPDAATGKKNVQLNALVGTDTLTLYSGNTNDVVTLSPGKILSTSSNTRISASNVEQIVAIAQGGKDIVRFGDSKGNDLFTAKNGSAKLTGSGFALRGIGFDKFYATASGGKDTAKLYDSKGNDKFIGKSTTAKLFGAGLFYQANKFDKVLAYASAGKDTAKLTDSSAADTFIGRKTKSILKSSKYQLHANKFEVVIVRASGGKDTAKLYDSSGNDVFVGDDKQAKLSGNGFFYQVKRFEKVNAFASSGNDKATLKGSTKVDKFVGRGKKATLSNRQFLLLAQKFDTVKADGRGGKDVLDARSVSYTLVDKNFEKIV